MCLEQPHSILDLPYYTITGLPLTQDIKIP